MKTVSVALALCLSVFWPSLSPAQSSVDHQFRILAHRQRVVHDSGLGFAFWGVIPDITQHSPLKTLLVAGGLLKGRGRWIEFMGGAFLKTDGSADAAFNMRASQAVGRTLLYAEVMYVLPQEKLILVPVVATRWFKAGAMNLGVGLESELTLKPGADSYGFGPRIAVKLPLLKQATLTTAYEWQSGQPFIRQYFLMSF